MCWDPAPTRAGLKCILGDIQDGTFAKNWIAENEAGRGTFMARRKAEQGLLLEKVGKDLRGMMPFVKAKHAPGTE